MGKNKNRNFEESNLLDNEPVVEENHVDSEATATEPSVAEPETPAEEVVTESVPAPAVEEKPDHGFYEESNARVYGVVNGKKCQRLNVRETPDKDARIISVIQAGAKVRIKKDKSTDMFYNISLSNGMNGFAMKDFIDEV